MPKTRFRPRQVSGRNVVLLPACHRCNGKRGTLYPCAGKIIACSPAFGEEILPRQEFPEGIALNCLPCQVDSGKDVVRIEFGQGKERRAKTFYRSAIAVHIEVISLGRHQRMSINTMVLITPPLCLSCQKSIDLTGGKIPVIVPKRGLLCDAVCEEAFLKANPAYQAMLESLGVKLAADRR